MFASLVTKNSLRGIWGGSDARASRIYVVLKRHCHGDSLTCNFRIKCMRLLNDIKMYKSHNRCTTLRLFELKMPYSCYEERIRHF